VFGSFDDGGCDCTPCLYCLILVANYQALLVLGCLRILGRGLCFDDIADFCNVSQRVVSDFFFAFIKFWSTVKYAELVRVPASEEEIEKDAADYAMAGLNGAIASSDACHIAWDRCNASLTTLAKGKEGFPTVVFQLVVNHRRRILHSTGGFLGATNDKTIARFDEYMMALRGCTALASNFKFKLFRANGTQEQHVGAYILTDNGYHRWRVLQSPVAHPATAAESLWTENVESIRKDVGAFFA
jgi:hypothetical protein